MSPTKRLLRKIDWATHGECTKCPRVFRLTASGSIWFHRRHGLKSGACPGAGLLPIARTVAQHLEESR